MKWLGYAGLAILMLLFALNGLIWWTAYHLPPAPKQADVMVILGAKVEGDPAQPHPILASRLALAADYLQANPQTQVVVCGSQMPGTVASEAAVMRDYLRQHGIDAARIHLETRSTRTAPQLLYANQVYPLHGKVILLTSDFHMLRSLLLARRSGFQVSPMVARTPFDNLDAWLMLLREPLALINSTVRDFPRQRYQADLQ